MTALTIDTLAISKRLAANGYTQQQAEVQAGLWAEFVDQKLVTFIEQKLATKDDLSRVENKLETKIRELEYHLTIKLGGMLVVSITIVTALLKTVH